MLAMADAAGFVYASVPGLANIAQVPIDKTKIALDRFLNTDEYSRDRDNDGQRIEEIDGGWAILNHPKYRKLRDADERKKYQREWAKRTRAAKKVGKKVYNQVDVDTNVDNVDKCRPQSTQEEGEEEADKDKSLSENSASISPVPYQKIIDLYHEHLPKLAKVVKLTNKRKTAIRNRWKDDADNLKFWEDYFKYCAKSKFLHGGNERGWEASIDFLVREDVIVKTQEGKYHHEWPGRTIK